MDSSSLVGVVTVTYNSAAVISGFMQSMLGQIHSQFRLYVVDNASSDDTLELLANYSDPRIAVVRNPENAGVAEGNNIGIRLALHDGCISVLLLNNDTEFDSDLLSTLSKGMTTYECEMIVPKVLYFEPPIKIWSAGGAFSRWRGISWHFGFNQADDGRFDTPREVAYAPTCCMLISRKVFERVGLMDSKYFVYFDDADFCLRAHRNGIRLLYLPAALIYHKVSSLIGQCSEIAIRYIIRNHVYYVMKNFPRWMAPYYLPICQVHAVRKCLQAKNVPKAFGIAQRAFWEGLILFYSKPEPRRLPPTPARAVKSAVSE